MLVYTGVLLKLCSRIGGTSRHLLKWLKSLTIKGHAASVVFTPQRGVNPPWYNLMQSADTTQHMVHNFTLSADDQTVLNKR